MRGERTCAREGGAKCVGALGGGSAWGSSSRMQAAHRARCRPIRWCKIVRGAPRGERPHGEKKTATAGENFLCPQMHARRFTTLGAAGYYDVS